MDSATLLKNGDLAGCKSALFSDIKKDPSNIDLRIFLFQLACIQKEWKRAETQLDLLKDLSGRSDAILAPNHTSRAYFGLNHLVERNSQLRYYEVVNAQHLDALNAFAGFNHRYVPLHHYFLESLDLMFDHLKNGTPLPQSQVVRPVPRGLNADASVPDLDRTIHLPTITAPKHEDAIEFVDYQVRIPN